VVDRGLVKLINQLSQIFDIAIAIFEHSHNSAYNTTNVAFLHAIQLNQRFNPREDSVILIKEW
jgi:hypothetical protein